MATGVNGFVVPALQPGDRISDWQPLFKASVTPLLAQENGETLAIGQLPAYVNRRTAEKELVQDAVQKTTLDDAFALLLTLDDPIDPYEAMQKLCRRNWVHGVHVEDFFYELKKLAKDASADLNLVCNILVAQLPKSVQQKAKEDLATKRGTGIITDVNARAFMTGVKKLLSNRGMQLDVGCQRLDEIDEQARVSQVSYQPPAAGPAGDEPIRRVEQGTVPRNAAGAQHGEERIDRV